MKQLALAILAIALSTAPIRAQEPLPDPDIPLSNSPSTSFATPAPLTYAQQTARFESEQRILRMQWNKWIGYEPLRPTMNASYMSNGVQRYYIPARGIIVSSGYSNAWYW